MSHALPSTVFELDAGVPPQQPGATAPARLTAASSRRLIALAGTAGGAGVTLGGMAWWLRPERFAFSYLAGFLWVVSIGLGALFFVLVQHVVRAGWSVAPRRIMEWVSQALPAAALLFGPMAALAPTAYRAWMAPGPETAEAVARKAAFLNAPFFYARAAVYLIVWSALARFFARASAAQDLSGDPAITSRLERASAPALLAFAVTTSFAGFDWVMSLDPLWASTIFGVYFFAGGVVGALAALAIVAVALHRAGLLGQVSTVEHRHDIGKLLFGFLIFWSYIAFCQYLLIWYANIPEETVWFARRWAGSWRTGSLLLVFGHFAIPFLALLGRAGKRSPLILGVTGAWLLVMHWLDLYWLVLPNFSPKSATPSWVDLAGFLAPAGIAAFAVSRAAVRTALYPVRDPRLAEAIALENP